jgi:hypothetical protein
MSIGLVFLNYIYWHYTRAFVDIYWIWKNHLWFIWKFFSVSLLFKTLLSPWKRLGEEDKSKGLDIEGFFGSLIVNTLMKVLGFLMRTALIFVAIFSFLLVFFLGLLFFIVWIFLPFLLVGLFITSIKFILS